MHFSKYCFVFLIHFSNVVGLLQKTYNVLSFSGGGAFGALEIGLLSKIHDTEPYEQYDLYTGVSAGGLNAGFLSHYENLDQGIQDAKKMYSAIKTKDVYEYKNRPSLGLLNTTPLRNTITGILQQQPEPFKKTIIGATNLYTGKMDKYYYNELSLEDRIDLLMSTTAIPILFPPVSFKNKLYADGGLITNEIVSDIVSERYINVTFITPYSFLSPKYNLSTFPDIIKRNFEIFSNTFNNEISKLNLECSKPRGEINMYYVNSDVLKNYSLLNFDNGEELIKIGYECMMKDKYVLC